METRAILGILCRYLAFYAGWLQQLRAGHDAPEAAHRDRWLGQQRRRSRRAGQPGVALEQPEEALPVLLVELHQRDQLVVDETAVGIEQEALTAGHARAEVAPVRTEHDHGATRHVLAGVVADTFDHSDGTGVADRESLPGRARDVELTTGRTVENRVADEARVTNVAGRRRNRD